MKDNNLYVGSTADLEKRIKYHNSGKVILNKLFTIALVIH